MTPRKPGGGRKRKLSLQQRNSILRSRLTVKELAEAHQVHINVIYHIFRDKNKLNKNFIDHEKRRVN